MCNDLPKKIKESDDSLLRNDWKEWVTFKRIIHDYNYWKKSKDSEPTNYI